MQRYALVSQPAAWLARLPGEGHMDRLCRVLVAAVVLLFPGLCLLVDRSDSLSLLLLGLIGVLVWMRAGFRSNLSRYDWLLVGVCYAFFVSALLSFEFGLQTSEGFRLLGRYLRFLFVLPLLIALKRYRPPAPVLWAGLGLGCLLIGMQALWEFVAGFGLERPAGDTDVAILFGDLAMLTGFAFAAGYPYIHAHLPRAGRLVAVYALLALLACFLSGSRGAWLAVPVLLTLFFIRRRRFVPRSVLVGTSGVIVLFIVLLLLPQLAILQRLRDVGSQLGAYRELKNIPAPAPGNPLCLDQPEALRSWLHTHDPYAGGIAIQVATVPAAAQAALAARGCTHGVALRIQNSSEETQWIALLRYQPGDRSGATTTLLMRGKGHVMFADQLAAPQRVDASGFTPVSVAAPARDGGALWIGIDPQAEISLLPLESYLGEYRYAMLETPVGLRLEMWSTALSIFREAPLLGIGTGAYQSGAYRLAAQGQATPFAADFDHPHSDYMNALSSCGLAGFAALMLLLAIPGWLFWKKLDSEDPGIMSAALGGLVAVVIYTVCALTETLFIHSVTIDWYVIISSVLFVSLNSGQQRH